MALFVGVLITSPSADAGPPAGWTDIELSVEGHDLVVDDARGVLYVSFPSLRVIGVIDAVTGDALSSIELASEPRGLALSADGDRLYAALNDAGSVAIIDLVTGSVDTIHVGATLGDARAWDVFEVDADRLLVSASPGSLGTAYIALTDIDGTNQKRVASNKIIRAGPVFARAGANHVLVGEGFSPNSLYKLDLTDPDIPVVLEDDHGSVSGTQSLAVSPDGTTVYLEGMTLRSSDFGQIGSPPLSGVAAPTADGAYVAYLGRDALSIVDAASNLEARRASSACAYRAFTDPVVAVSSDGATLYSLTDQRVCADSIVVLSGDYAHDTAPVDLVCPSPSLFTFLDRYPYSACTTFYDGVSCPAGSTLLMSRGPEAEQFFGPGGRFCDWGPTSCPGDAIRIGVLVCRQPGHVPVDSFDECAEILGVEGAWDWIDSVGVCARIAYEPGYTDGTGAFIANGQCYFGIGPVDYPTGPLCYQAWTKPGAAPPTCDGRFVTIDMNTNGGVGVGTAGDDVILGTPGADSIDAGAGDDTVCAGSGNDTVIAGDGDDRVFGEDGNDVVRGNAGADHVDGGPGADRLFGGVGDDWLVGRDGDDYLGGYGGSDVIGAGKGDDVGFGGFGADEILGDDGHDVMRGLVGNDRIDGGAGNDVLDGDRGSDVINGGSGADVVNGGNAGDTLFGDGGNDSVNGGRADDLLSGGYGIDVCAGNLHFNGDTTDGSCETTHGVP